MKVLRTLSTGSLVVLLAAVAIVAVGGTAIAIAAGGSGPVPAPKPLAQAIHDGLAAPEPQGVTARIVFTNKLLPSGALEGRVGSALMSGASGRLWLTNDGRGRLELQSTAGDAQIVWNPKTVTVFDASSNTVYRASLPAGKSDPSEKTAGAPPSLAKIQDILAEVGKHANISGAEPTDVGGEPAYNVTVSHKEAGGLLGSLQLAWDATHGVPLRAAIYARGASKPVLALEATEIRFGPVPAADVEIAPPAGAKTTQLSPPSNHHQRDQKDQAQPQGSGDANDLRAAAQAAAGFPLVAPDTLAGLQRSDVRVVGADPKTVLVVYGQGLGAIVVAEHKADAAGRTLAGLPEVSLDGATGHELATPLGTVIEWQRAGVTYVLAGSVPSATAEAAARSLK